METKPYLIFLQNGLLCGVEACCVQEIFLLPELTPVAEAPHDIVGAIELRGEILPVMDLNLRLGYLFQEYSLTDSVVVIKWENFRVGIIVNQVREVKNISEDAITAQLSHGRENPHNSEHFVAGFARCEANILMLLNLERLIQYSPATPEINSLVCEKDTDIQETAIESETESLQLEKNSKLGTENPKFYAQPHVFCAKAGLEEKAVFKERARNLRQQVDRDNSRAINMSVAVVTLNGEYFGVNLAIVREFTEIRQVTPIPCTPDRIVGNMNLRGEIVTLLDIRNVFNMPAAINSLSKAIVIEVAEFVAGIVVDEILDIIYLNVSEIGNVPAALHSASREYLRGTAIYGDKIMAILNLEKLLLKGGVVVDEEV